MCAELRESFFTMQLAQLQQAVRKIYRESIINYYKHYIRRKSAKLITE